MTGSQYKNIIQWTLNLEKDMINKTCLEIIRKIFNNLGVAFPQGNCEEISHILENNDYIGWRSCSCEESQRFADKGVAAIGIELDSIIIIF